MDNTYQIITDATADLDPQTAAAPELKVIPMPVTMEGRTFHHYCDFREMPAKEFYDHLRRGSMPQTAQINILTYLRAFIPPLKAGKDVVYLCFSSGLSGTIQSAHMVMAVLREKFPQRKIVCIDTLAASVGQGFFVYQALQRQREGDSFQQLCGWAEEHKLQVAHWFTVEDLNHLHRGGRLSKTAAVAGTMLQIKPILTLDREGHLQVAGKVRGTVKAYQSMIARMKETCTDFTCAYIGHCDAPESAEKLAQMARDAGIQTTLIAPIGPVIGSHVGAGMTALVYWDTGR